MTVDYLLTGKEPRITGIIPAMKAVRKPTLKAKKALVSLVEELLPELVSNPLPWPFLASGVGETTNRRSEVTNWTFVTSHTPESGFLRADKALETEVVTV